MRIPVGPEMGRKSAYFARNRARLIRAAQTCLAEHGFDVTVDQIAEAAEMSVSTVYKHFESKDLLLEVAEGELFGDWEAWALSTANQSDDSLEQFVIPLRLFFRVQSTHPDLGKFLKRNLEDLAPFSRRYDQSFRAHAEALLTAGVLRFDSPELRIRSFIACVLSAQASSLSNDSFDEAQADKAVELALMLLDVEKDKAAALTRSALPIESADSGI